MGDEEILSALSAAISQALPGVDAETLETAMAVTGLLAAVAIADRHIAPDEFRLLTGQLSGVDGFDPKQAEAVADMIEQYAPRLSATYIPRFTRTIHELVPEGTRRGILEALVRMAAADGVITPEEVINLRNITQAIGLSQTLYDEFEQKHQRVLGH